MSFIWSRCPKKSFGLNLQTLTGILKLSYFSLVDAMLCCVALWIETPSPYIRIKCQNL